MSKSQRDKFIKTVEAARQGMANVLAPTPLQKNEFLSQRYGASIYLKREDLSPVRSYKIRGAFNFFRKAIESHDKKPHFVCASAGNHAQGFAFACQHFGVKGTIFMPVTTPQQKIDKTKSFGGDKVKIVFEGDFFDDCNQAALTFAKDKGALMVPPFDHRDVIEGQATVGLELLSQIDAPIDLLMMPIGGGGLAAGMCELFKRLSPKTKILFVEPEGAPSFQTALRDQKRTKLKQIDGFVDGAAVAQIGKLNFDLLKDRDEKDVLLVPEDSLCETIIEMLNVEGIVLEPAGALEIDALRQLPKSSLKGKTIVCIASGGNFDFERLPEVKERALKAAGRKKYYIIRLPQRPGALKELLNYLGPNDDIARFEYLKKSARNFGSILLGVETNNKDNFATFTDKLNRAGIRFEDITNDDTVASFIV